MGRGEDTDGKKVSGEMKKTAGRHKGERRWDDRKEEGGRGGGEGDRLLPLHGELNGELRISEIRKSSVRSLIVSSRPRHRHPDISEADRRILRSS